MLSPNLDISFILYGKVALVWCKFNVYGSLRSALTTHIENYMYAESYVIHNSCHATFYCKAGLFIS